MTKTSALRTWLRKERAGDHRRWVEGPACPVCDTRKLVVTAIQSLERFSTVAYECDNGHRWIARTWKHDGISLTIEGSAQ